MNKQFELNGKIYKADAETVALIRKAEVMLRLKNANSVIAVIGIVVIMVLGQLSGRITEVK